MSNSIDIIGLGARTSVGWDASSTASSVRAGLARFAEYSDLLDAQGNPVGAARIPYLAPEITGADRFLALGLPAAEEALKPLSASAVRDLSLDILIGLPLPRPELLENLSDKVIEGFSKHFAKQFKINDIQCLPLGHAAGLIALKQGQECVATANGKACLIGGIDHYLIPEIVAWLDKNEQLLTENNPWGFIPGEGAGFCLLVSRDIVEKLNCPVLGQVVSTALAYEKKLIKSDTVCLGEGLTSAIREAVQPFEAQNILMDDIITDLNGEPYRAEELGYALLKTEEYFKDTSDFKAPVVCWGDVGAASGPLFVILALMAGQKGYNKGPHALILTSSESGERSVVVTKI